MLRNIAIAALVCAGTVSAASDHEYREFTSNDGRVIQAVLIDKSDDEAVLLMRNGQRATVPLERLSEDDQQYVTSWSREKAIFLQKCRTLTIRQCLELRGYESFEFRFKNNSIFIDGKINGEPARVLIDTGAGISLLHAPYVEEIGLTVGPLTETVRGVAGEARAGWTDIPTLQLGEAVFNDQRILATDLLKGKPEGARSREDLILGAEFMRQLDAVISYPERRIFLRPDRSDQDEAGLGDGTGSTDFRIFRLRDGTVVRGKITSKTPTVATFQLVNGRSQPYPIDRFTDEDAAFIRNWTEAGALFLEHCQGLTIEDLLTLRGYQSFQFERRGNHLFVDGTLNEQPATYMIDTGADSSLLNLRAATDANCAVGPMDQEVWGIGGSAPAAVTEIPILTMGDAVLTNRRVLATDLNRNDPDLDLGYVGLFGADFMRELDAVLTYTEDRIFLIQR